MNYYHVGAAAVFTVAVSCGWSASNVDPVAKFGWGENAGWVNLYGDIATGVEVSPDYLQGFAWMESAGWLNLGLGVTGGADNHYTNTAPDALTPPNFGINNDRAGNLWGLAWSENAGWINFGESPAASYVSIDASTGRFSGNAWSENLGWISFETVPLADVATVPATAVPVTLGLFRLE